MSTTGASTSIMHWMAEQRSEKVSLVRSQDIVELTVGLSHFIAKQDASLL